MIGHISTINYLKKKYHTVGTVPKLKKYLKKNLYLDS